MKVLYDLSPNQPQGSMKINGGGEYALMILDYLFNNRRENDSFDVILNSDLQNNPVAVNFCAKNKIKVLRYSSLSDFSKKIELGEYDTLFLPVCYQKYRDLKVSDNVRIISVIHDLCEVYCFGNGMVKYGKFPKEDFLNPLRIFKERLIDKRKTKEAIDNHNAVIRINNNQNVITVSNFSKSSFIKYLDVDDAEKIKVLYPPENRKPVVFDDNIENRILNNYDLKTNRYFFLCAGCRWAKNNAIALFVLDKMFSNKKYTSMFNDFKVIITGVDDVYREYYKRHINNLDKYIFEGYVDNITMEVLFKNAHMFLFPSVLEGFGQPPIEAMKYGTLVACSTSMCIPEVCADAAIYFDPLNEDSIELAIIESFDLSFSKQMIIKEKRRIDEIEKLRNDGLKKMRKIFFSD